MNDPKFEGVDRYSLPPSQIPDLMSNPVEQSKIQEAAARVAKKTKLDMIAEETGEPTSPVTRGVPGVQPAPVDRPKPDYQKKHTSELVDKPASEKQMSLKDRIASIERELDGGTTVNFSKNSSSAKTFLDDMGDETFYVENISNGHVVISDIDMDKVARGSVIDLLQFGDIDTIKKSRDLRVALSGHGSAKLLKRLTPEEYLDKIEKQLSNKRKIELFRAKADMEKDTYKAPDPVRPIIESKLEKLRLRALSPIEFIEWIQTEQLTISELDRIQGEVQDNDIRMFILERKKEIMK